MATLQSRGSSIVTTVLTTWANTTNAYDGTVGTNPATYATYVNAARSTVGSITIGGYTFPGVAGTINSVTADIRHMETATNITAVSVQLKDSTGTAVGSAIAATLATTAHTNTLTLGTPTLAQVQAGLQVIVSVTRANSTTSTTFSLDQVDLTVTYTPPPTPTGSVSGVAQYASDMRTPIAIGGETTNDGFTNPLYLQMLVNNSNDQGYDNVPGVEVQPVGTSFTGTPNYVANSFKAQEPYEPTAMRGSVMGYDAINKRFIMTHGYDGTTRFNDVWELDASGMAGKWKRLTTTGSGTPGKNLGAATMVNQNGKAWFVLWGGNTGSDTNTMYILDCTTRGAEAWTTVTQTTPPSARSYETLELAYVPTSTTGGDLYYFGGWASTRENLLVKTTLNTAGSVPSALTWTTVSANGAAGAPTGRSGCILYYDSYYNRLVVHGGYTTVGVSDTWAWSLSSGGWTQLFPTGTAPVGRELFAAAYDPPSQRLVVAGGWSTEASTSNRNDMYQIDFSTSSDGVFTNLKTNDYPDCDIDPFSSIASAYDSNRRIMATSGINGYDGTDRYSYAFDFTETVVPNQMSLYGLNIIDWQRARDAPAYAVDSSAGELLMINGFSGMPDDTLAANALNGDHMNEIWAYNPTTNTTRYANQGVFGIPYKEGVFACYDSINNRIITYGGLTGATQVCGGVWELKRDTYGNYKARKMYPSGTPPAPRWLMAGAFDHVNNRMIVWGGTTASAMQDNQLHILDLSGGGDGVWSAVTGGGTTPPVVWQPGYAKDWTNNRLYVSSGATNFGASTFSTRTDYLDMTPTTPTWTNVNTTGITGARGTALMYAPPNGTKSAGNLWIFGGYNGSVVNNQLLYMPVGSGGTTWTSWGSVGGLPVARRSSASWVYNDGTYNNLFISSGRPVSGTWYRDYNRLQEDISVAQTSQTIVDRAPPVYEHDSVIVNNLSTYQAYHWQAINTILGTTFTGSFGANLETATDFYGGVSSATAPTVTDSAPTSITDSSATGNGNVTSDGGGYIMERGFVWDLSTNADPTTATNAGKLVVSGSTGAFTGSLTGLAATTTYKYRAYAKNGKGTSYGATQTFNTTAYSPKTFTIASVMSNIGGGTTYMALYNRTSGAVVTDSEMSTTSATPVLVTQDFELGGANFNDLSDYELRVKVSSGTANVFSAKLLIRQKNLTKTMTYNRVSRFGFQALSATSAVTTSRFLYSAANYSSPVATWEVTGTEDTNGTNSMNLYNVTTTDSGTTGSLVSGTAIDVNSTSKVRVRNSVSLVDTNRYIGYFSWTSGGARFLHGLVNVAASGTLGTVDVMQEINLLDLPRSSQLGTDYTMGVSRTPFNPADFDNATYYFEVVGTNTNTTQPYIIYLVAEDALGNETQLWFNTFNANTGSSNVRYRNATSFTIPSSTRLLKLQLDGTAAAKNVTVGSAKLIAVQTNATKTTTYVPMGGSNVEWNDDVTNPFIVTTQTTYATLATNVDQFTIWHRDDTEFSQYQGYNTSPTATLTTADASSFSTATPALQFSGTDAESNDIAYEIGITTATPTATSISTNSASVQQGQAPPITISFTMPSVTNGMLLVPIFDSSSYPITSITYNGIALTRVESSDSSINFYYLLSPPAGTYNLVISRPTGLGSKTTTIYALQDVNQTTPISSYVLSAAYSSGTSVTNSVTVANPGSMVFNLVEYSSGDGGTGVSTVSPSTLSMVSNGGATSNPNRAYYLANAPTGTNDYTVNFNASTGRQMGSIVINPSVLAVVDASSITDAGFVDTTNGGDTSPFTSGDSITYTLQSGLSNGTYYWRVRGIDLAGTNAYGSWTSVRSFTVSTAGSTIGYKKVNVGGTWTKKPVKVYKTGAWTQKPVKVYKAGSWTSTS